MALRLFWRVVAPGHPRGWLDLHPILNDSGTEAWLHCHGMERWGLPNIEFRDVPVDLLGPAHGILLALTGYMKFEKVIAPDESIGGLFTSDDQKVLHQATLRRSPEPEEGHEGLLRVVDIAEPADSRFPYRLFAAHLITIADDERSLARQEHLYRRATEIYRGQPATEAVPLEDAGQNPQNYFGWEGLGFALAEQGKHDEAIVAFKEAVNRWPEGARGFAEEVRKQVAEGALPPPEQNQTSRFWCELAAS